MALSSHSQILCMTVPRPISVRKLTVDQIGHRIRYRKTLGLMTAAKKQGKFSNMRVIFFQKTTMQ